MQLLYMVSAFDSILLGFVQGMTEFLPISSSGHLILAREVLGIEQAGGLAFDAVLQLATALAVIVYFRKDIWDLIRNLWIPNRDTSKTRLTWFLIIGSIPAVVAGLFLKDSMETVFRNPSLVAITLIIGAILMYLADRYLALQESKNKQTPELTFKKSFIVGLWQALALVPGMSRSGMSISGGYFVGLQKDQAVRFSFLLSIPIICGSGMIKVLDIMQDPSSINSGIPILLLGALTAFVCGWIAIDFLLKFLKTNTFNIFVIYRIMLACAIFIFFL